MRRRGITIPEPSTFGSPTGRRAAAPALVALLAAMVAVPGTVDAQDRASAEPAIEDISGETLVARFDLPPEALDGVTSSVELVAALREHLTVDLAMPLDEPLVLSLHGSAGRQEGGQGPVYRFGLSSLGVGFQGEGPPDDFSYALAVRETHGEDFPPDGDEWAEFAADDWDEEEAWNKLVRALDVGLPQSAAEFGRPGEGEHLALSVTDVHLREFTLAGPGDSAWGAFGGCCPELADRAVLMIRPELRLQSMSTAGDDAARDVPIRLNVVAIELDPGPAESGRADPAAEPTTSAEGAAGPDGGSGLAAPDADALAMTRTLQGACHAPQLASSDVASTSEIMIAGEARTGEAMVAFDGEVDQVLKLGGGEGAARFCLILIGRGGPSEPGTYPIQRLTTDRMESEPDPADPWMVVSLGSGAHGETLFVAESGTVEFTAMEPSVRGSFEFVGWRAHGESRAEEMRVTGSFDAVPAAR